MMMLLTLPRCATCKNVLPLKISGKHRVSGTRGKAGRCSRNLKDFHGERRLTLGSGVVAELLHQVGVKAVEQCEMRLHFGNVGAVATAMEELGEDRVQGREFVAEVS